VRHREIQHREIHRVEHARESKHGQADPVTASGFRWSDHRTHRSVKFLLAPRHLRSLSVLSAGRQKPFFNRGHGVVFVGDDPFSMELAKANGKTQIKGAR
jgi:hypothetical protein